MTNKEVYEYELEKVKKDPMYIYTFDEPSEEMLWIGVINDLNNIFRYKLTDDMYRECMRRNNEGITRAKFNTSILQEDDILEGLSKEPGGRFHSPILLFIAEECTVTKKIAVEICKKCCLFYNKYKDIITDEDSQRQIVEEYLKQKLNTDRHVAWSLSEDLEYSEDDWDLLSSHKLISDYMIGHYKHKIPEKIKKEFILAYPTNIKYILCPDADDFYIWITTMADKCTSWQLKDINYIFYSPSFVEGYMKTDGKFIEKVKSPSAALKKAAIEIDPMNILLIKNPSEKLCIMAINANPDCFDIIENKTEKLYKLLGMEMPTEEKTPYPGKYYLCKFRENLADEGYLVKVMVVPGNKMQEFLDKKTSISFGNMYDDDEMYVKDICDYKEITEEEYQILKRLELTSIESGYWSNLDN